MPFIITYINHGCHQSDRYHVRYLRYKISVSITVACPPAGSAATVLQQFQSLMRYFPIWAILSRFPFSQYTASPLNQLTAPSLQ